MARNEKTSPKLASLAAKVLASKKSSVIARRLAATALTQAADKKKRSR